MPDDTDSSEDGGLRAHFRQYYGDPKAGTVNQTQTTAPSEQPNATPAAVAPTDSDVIPLLQRRQRLHRSLPPTRISGTHFSESASPDSDERWTRLHHSLTPTRHRGPDTPGMKNRGGSSATRMGRGRSLTPIQSAGRPRRHSSHTLQRHISTPPALRGRSFSPKTHVGPSGPRKGLRSQNRWPTPSRPPSPTGASPDKPILLSDSTSDQQIPTPVVPREQASRQFTITRKSLRIQVQGGPVDIISKAKKRVRERGEGSSSTSGIPLVNSFPFRRLTLDQIVDLFRVYQIQLGNAEHDHVAIIQAIQQLDRAQFEKYVKELLDRTKSSKSLVVADIKTFQVTENSIVNQ